MGYIYSKRKHSLLILNSHLVGCLLVLLAKSGKLYLEWTQLQECFSTNEGGVERRGVERTSTDFPHLSAV